MFVIKQKKRLQFTSTGNKMRALPTHVLAYVTVRKIGLFFD